MVYEKTVVSFVSFWLYNTTLSYMNYHLYRLNYQLNVYKALGFLNYQELSYPVINITLAKFRDVFFSSNVESPMPSRHWIDVVIYCFDSSVTNKSFADETSGVHTLKTNIYGEFICHSVERRHKTSVFMTWPLVFCGKLCH